MTTNDFFDAGGNYGAYMDWECYKNGMYIVRTDKEKIKLAISLLTNVNELRDAMDDVVFVWHKSCDHHLTKYKANRNSWLGQAACNKKNGCTDDETKAAWNMLDKKQQDTANSIADIVIMAYDRKCDDQLTFMEFGE